MKKSIRKLKSFGKKIAAESIIEIFFKIRLNEVVKLNNENCLLSNTQTGMLNYFFIQINQYGGEEGIQRILKRADTMDFAAEVLGNLLSDTPLINLYEQRRSDTRNSPIYPARYMECVIKDSEFRALPKQVTMENLRRYYGQDKIGEQA